MPDTWHMPTAAQALTVHDGMTCDGRLTRLLQLVLQNQTSFSEDVLAKCSWNESFRVANVAGQPVLVHGICPRDAVVISVHDPLPGQSLPSCGQL